MNSQSPLIVLEDAKKQTKTAQEILVYKQSGVVGWGL